VSSDVPVTEARERFSELVAAVSEAPVFLTKHGKRQAVLISADEYERLLGIAEDTSDVAFADEAIDAVIRGAPTILWAEVKADLGLA